MKTVSDWLSKAIREKFPDGVESLSPVSQSELLQILLKRAAYTGPQGIQGRQGIQGEKGETGAAPAHEWDGTSIRFQNPDGTWGPWVDLVGDEPEHEWSGTKLRFKHSDGTWGEWVDLLGAQGLPPEHQWLGSKLRFKNPGGEWGDWRELLGKQGREGERGPPGKDGAPGKDGKPGAKGKDGKDGKPGKDGKDGKPGPAGDPPAHEVRNRRIRFKKPNGEWGQWLDFGAGQLVYQAGTDTSVIDAVPCDASVYVGAAVVMIGGVAFNALADTLANSAVIGFCEEKIGPTSCRVRTHGITRAIFSGLNPNAEYLLSETTAGQITPLVASGAGHFVARLGKPFDATRFIVNIQLRMQRAL